MPIQENIQTSSANHAVPQNIMDVEFKLIGDLTMRQFFYILISGGVAWLAIGFLDNIFKWPIAIVSALLGLGLAFVPLEDRGLDQWIINFFKSVYSPTQRVWKKNPIVPNVFTYQNLAMVRQELITLAPTSSRRKLEEYLEFHDFEKPRDRLDMQEDKYIKMVKDAFVTVEEIEPGPSYQPSVQVYEEPQLQQQVPPTNLQEQPEPAPPLIPTQTPQEPPVQTIQPTESTPISITPTTEPPVAQPISVSMQPLAVGPKPQKPKKIKQTSSIYMEPMTPDRHSGRVFTNLLPKQGVLVLPIRGERVIKTSEETDIEESIEEKGQQLQKLIAQIKGDEQLKPQNQQNNTEVQTQEAKGVLEKIKTENLRLTQELEQAKTQQVGQQQVEQIQKLEKAKKLATLEYEALQDKIRELEGELKVKERVTGIAQRGISAETHASPPPISAQPNIVVGVVRDASGFALENVVVLIKNAQGDPKRALKTNSLGQFTSNTPLTNGTYRVEVDGGNRTGLSFDIISIQANGQRISPLEIVGKKAAQK